MCDTVMQSGVRDARDCKCHRAVMRAYTTMVRTGCPQSVALDAASIVYAHHHPEDTKSDQRLTVERWVNADSLH